MKINLTRIAIILAICLTCVSAAMATPACGQASATSPTQNAAFSPLYVTASGSSNSPGYVCDIGNLQFSDFTYADAGGLPPTSVTAEPVTTSGQQGFNFAGGWTGNQDATISFMVTALTGDITSVNIDILGANTSGTGNISYLEQFCTVGGSSTCSLFTDTPTGNLSTSISLSASNLGAPQTSLMITKDVDLSTGSNGTAFISAFGNTYNNSTVPEPRAVSILLSLGLFAVVVFMKKRSQAVRS
jgi:hypothetical protein